MVLLYINSQVDRQPTDTTSKWTTYLAYPFEIANAKVALKSIQIPNVATQFKLSNSIFWIANQLGYAFGLMIDHTRFYETLTDVITALNSQITQYTASYGLDCEFSVENNKIVLTNKSAYNIRFVSSRAYEVEFSGGHTILNGADYNGVLFNQMNSKLGATIDYRDLWILPNASMKLSGVPRLIRTNAFYLECSLVDEGVVLPTPEKQPDIISKVPCLVNFGSLITYEPQQLQYFNPNDNNIDRIEFNLLDDELEDVDLQGANITLTLEFQF